MEVTGVVTIGTKERSKRDMKKIVFAFGMIVAVVMTACTPETRNQMLGIPDDAILLSTENFASNDTKTSVRGTSVIWVGDEDIDFYVGEGSKQTRSVVVDGSNAYIATSLTGEGVIRGYYPAGIVTNRQTADNPAVKIPDEYSYSVSGGRQVIGLPMVATADSNANKIKFYHVTAAINVMLKNSENIDLYIDSVLVFSDSYGLNHTTGFAVTISRDNPPVVTKSTTEQGASFRRVKLSFPTPLKVSAGSSDSVVQVPIRPIGIDNLTIKVYCKGGESRYIYSHSNTLLSELKRNEVLTAKVDLRLETNNGGHMVEVEETYRSIDMATASFPFTAQNGDTLYGTRSSYLYTTITIPDGATVTLRDFKSPAITIKAEGTSTVNLVGTNSVTSSVNRPAVFVSNGYTLTIKGTGTITATGGNNSAGIGCGTTANGYANCGNIEIEGGTINAKGGSGAAGIGTGSNTDNICGNITIKSTVTSVTATKGSGATESIGKGNANSACGTITIADGANVTQN